MEAAGPILGSEMVLISWWENMCTHHQTLPPHHE